MSGALCAGVNFTQNTPRSSLRQSPGPRADTVWDGLGTPKKAPAWTQRAGLEWLFRLVAEPRRLARRYVVYNWKFLRLLWCTPQQRSAGVPV